VRADWVTGAHELSTLLHAGLPMLEALDTLARQHVGPFRTALLAVRERVAAGASLAEALGDRPDLFDPATVHLVEVGEHAGTLEFVLEQLAEFKLRLLQFKDQVLTALVYPAFLALFGTAAGVFLMTAVMPPLLENLQETLDTLPWPTRVVKAGSEFLLSSGWLLLAGGAVAAVAATVVLRSERGRLRWHRFLLRLPLIGPLLLKQGVARVAMIVGTLCRSGVVMTRAIELASSSTENLVLRGALDEAGERIGAGEDVAAALERTGVFPPVAVRMFAVGQESGRLDEMLTRLATDYERQISTVCARMTALVEPLLILVLAVFVGFLLLATILPILEAGHVL
jgi:type II secretory pathway component PulF